ncbi:MAG: hypothetical protein V4760_16460 [Bdellovibrionota bacterium]
MQKMIIGALAPAIVPALARRARISWLGYGVAAYVALRLAKHYGVGGDLPDRALGAIDGAVRSYWPGFGGGHATRATV